MPIPYIHNVCSVCKSQQEKERYHALPPEAKRAKGVRANQQALLRRHALQTEIAKRDERIVALKKRIGHPKSNINGETLVDAIPFRMFLIKQRTTYGSVAKMAHKMGVNAERVRRFINGYWLFAGNPQPIKQVTIGVVDEYLVRLHVDENLEDLYPELYGHELDD